MILSNTLNNKYIYIITTDYPINENIFKICYSIDSFFKLKSNPDHSKPFFAYLKRFNISKDLYKINCKKDCPIINGDMKKIINKIDKLDVFCYFCILYTTISILMYDGAIMLKILLGIMKNCPICFC